MKERHLFIKCQECKMVLGGVLKWEGYGPGISIDEESPLAFSAQQHYDNHPGHNRLDAYSTKDLARLNAGVE